MALTQKDLNQIVQILDPKFKELNIEIGNMIAPLATKDELQKLDNKINGRIDEFEERFQQFAGDTAVFQTQVINRFDNLDEKLSEHDDQFKQIIKQVGAHSTQFRDQESRIKALESK